jgi:DNA mismatch repair protein MutL
VEELSFTNREFLSKLYTPPQTTSAGPSSLERVDTCTGEIVEPDGSCPKDSSEPTAAGADEAIRMVGRFSDLYLIFQRRDELLIIDQHTAHERVLFEDLLRQIERQSVVAQGLLLPVQVELSPEQLALYDEVEPLLNQSGFSIEHFGGRTLKIEAVPSVLTRRSPETSVVRILDDFSSLKKAGYDLKKAMAQSIACRSAVMAGDRLSDREAMALIIALLKCENIYSCPHGRPTLIRMTRSDLDHQFGRG